MSLVTGSEKEWSIATLSKVNSGFYPIRQTPFSSLNSDISSSTISLLVSRKLFCKSHGVSMSLM